MRSLADASSHALQIRSSVGTASAGTCALVLRTEWPSLSASTFLRPVNGRVNEKNIFFSDEHCEGKVRLEDHEIFFSRFI